MRRKSFLLLICFALMAAFLAKPVSGGGGGCVDDGLEDDDTVVEANVLDASADIAAQSCSGDPDVYRIFLPAGFSYTVTATPSASFDLALDWLDENGNVISPPSPIDDGLTGDAESHVAGFADDLWVYYRVRGAVPSDGTYTIGVTGIPAPLPISTIGAAVTDDFDWLDPDSQSSQFDTGWRIWEEGSNQDFLYVPGDGSSGTGDTYSYGTGTSTERAFGTLGEGGSPGLLHSELRLFMRNDTGSTIESLDVSYTGEQWRLGATGRGADRLDAQFRREFDDYAAQNPLDLASPNTTATGALDGNAVGNKVAVSAAITNLDIAPGEHFFLSWLDADIGGAEDGLAIDDLSITASAPPPDEDGDGVPDAGDLCSGTPTGREVDANGCEFDDDEDGVVNGDDSCPFSNLGAPVDANGCEFDDDEDGVPNTQDACLTSPPDDPVGPDGCAFALTVTRKGKGRVRSSEVVPLIDCGPDCSQRYPSETQVTLVAKPKKGWRFVKWGLEGACPGLKSKTCGVMMDGDTPARAIFKKR